MKLQPFLSLEEISSTFGITTGLKTVKTLSAIIVTSNWEIDPIGIQIGTESNGQLLINPDLAYMADILYGKLNWRGRFCNH